MDASITRNPTPRAKMAVSDWGRESLTHYRILLSFPAHTILAGSLESGRIRQVRMHIEHIRHPLLSDPAYNGLLKIPRGADADLRDRLRQFFRQVLHVSWLDFTHPTTEEKVEFKKALPKDFIGLFAALHGKQSSAKNFNVMEWPEHHL